MVVLRQVWADQPQANLRMKFVPCNDITAYELAQVLSRLTLSQFSTLHDSPVMFTADQWRMLDPTLKRHFAECT